VRAEGDILDYETSTYGITGKINRFDQLAILDFWVSTQNSCYPLRIVQTVIAHDRVFKDIQTLCPAKTSYKCSRLIRFSQDFPHGALEQVFLLQRSTQNSRFPLRFFCFMEPARIILFPSNTPPIVFLQPVQDHTRWGFQARTCAASFYQGAEQINAQTPL